MSLIGWPVPEPVLPAGVPLALAEAVQAAASGFRSAREAFGRRALAQQVACGADGTPMMRVDALVEEGMVDVARRRGVNLLSEEVRFLDHGSAVTLVVDPLDGSANAAAGVPLCGVAAVLVQGERAAAAVTCWLDTGRCWYAEVGAATGYRTTGRRELDGAAVSLLRPHARNAEAWWRVARRASRVRILSTSCLEAALVTEGSTDAFADAGSDTHRIVDLAAAMVMTRRPAGRCSTCTVGHWCSTRISPAGGREWSRRAGSWPRTWRPQSGDGPGMTRPGPLPRGRATPPASCSYLHAKP